MLGYIKRTPKNTIEKFRTSFLPPSTQILPYLAQRSGQPYVPIFHIPWILLHSEFASYICKAKIHIVEKYGSNYQIKVEKILKGSLNFIPSPSPLVKIQIMGGKACFMRCKKTFENKKFVDITQQYFALLPQVNFRANDLYFH